MKKGYNTILLAIICLLAGCSDDASDEVAMNILPGEVKYKVTFTFNWSKTDFPKDYPSSAHFSKLVGWTHKPDSTFLTVGTLASSGIKSMAETGSVSPLDTEINMKINDGEGYKLYAGNGLGSGTGKIELIVAVTKDYSNVSLVSMIAPSPDWYVGIVNVSLLDGDAFVSDMTITGKVYDSGTDDGVTFTSPNAASSPPQPISLITQPPLGDGTSVDETFCTVTFMKQ